MAKKSRAFVCGGLLLVCFVAQAQSEAKPQRRAGILFQQRVTWEADREPRPWQTVVDASDGRYRVALVPLWAVEGGIVAVEIVLAHERTPDDNLFGERQSDTEQPFVITVETLEKGARKSRFGVSRLLNAGSLTLNAKILSSRLGEGVGECKTCRNIQQLTLSLTLDSR